MASSDPAVLRRVSKGDADPVASRSKKPVQVSADAAFDPESGKVDALSAEEQQKLELFRRATHDFFNPKSIDELIKEQGVKPIDDFDKLALFDDDDDVEEWVQWIYTNCRSASPR